MRVESGAVRLPPSRPRPDAPESWPYVWRPEFGRPRSAPAPVPPFAEAERPLGPCAAGDPAAGAAVVPRKVTLSVVVPFHDVERHVEECLESLAAQTLPDLEVIMVDDGSPDNSAVIAKSYAARDPRFRLVQQENQGLGAARNAGVRHATGTYLAFADGDDVVAHSAYELLVGSLERTGSDLAAGNIRRLGPADVRPSPVHREIFRETRLRTHVTRYPRLLRDRAVGNTVFRRSFWDGAGLEFPGRPHDDGPVTVRAMVLAGAVDLHRDTVYYWREADGPAAEHGDLAGRMASVRRLRAVLAEHTPEILGDYDRYAIEADLAALVEALAPETEEGRRRLAAIGRSYVADLGAETVATLPALRRLVLYLLGAGRITELLDVAAVQRTAPDDACLTRRGALKPRFFADYPLAGRLPAHLFDVTDELRLRAGVDDVAWVDGRMRIEGHAYIERLDMAHQDRLDVWLEHAGTGRRVELPVERTYRPDVTAASGQAVACYDGSGLVAEIDPRRLATDGRWRSAEWRLHAEVRAQGLRRTGTFDGQAPGRATWPPLCEVAEDVRVQLARSDGGPLVVRVKRVTAIVTRLRRDGDAVELTGWASVPADGGAALTVTRRLDGAAVRVPAMLSPAGDGGSAFHVRLPLAQPAAEPGVPAGVARAALSGEGIQWDIAIEAGDVVRRVAAGEGLPSVRRVVADREIALTRTRYGNLSIVERSPRLTVDEITWRPGSRLALDGTAGDGAPRPGELILRHRRTSEEHRCPIAWDGDRFTAEPAPTRAERFGERLPLAGGTWDLLVRTPAGDAPVVADRAGLGRLPGARLCGAHEVRPMSHRTDALHLRVGVALADDEHGRYAQRVLRERDYPAYRTDPLRDIVVFDCYEGAQYACNPRAIYEELRGREPGLEYVWVTRDGGFTVPEGARAVPVGGRDHYRVLGRARFIVGNYRQPPWFRRREGQFYLQTWHGTPLKKLAYDLLDRPLRSIEPPNWMAGEVPQWDLLLSPNPFTTKIMRGAFRYDGKILESGYPRNDVLMNPRRERIAAAVRARLGLPPGKRVVLYAPTWRDDLRIAPGRRGFTLELDVDRLRADLGDDTVLLVRAHYLVTDRAWSQTDAFVFDVSGYPDVAELYLVADVLVTDYSSAMFDFAVTRRPMLFFAYDLERYRDRVRGFYFDLAAEAPGPLLRTTGEVIGALRDLDGVTEQYADAYASFTERYCPYDDGGAAARVVDHVFAKTGA